MITEDYCNFEIAKLLKEKEFDGECIGYYWDMDKTFGIHYELLSYSDGNLRNELILAPTLQMAMKWLREVHKLYMYTAFAGMEEVWFSRIYNKDKHQKDLDNFNTYEEACEAAIKYCLENLI